MIAILLIVLGLGGLIFIHELGHFLVAKWAGVKVEVFSIGFGWKFLKTTYGETEYALSAIPLGGYVKMAGEIPGEGRELPAEEEMNERVREELPRIKNELRDMEVSETEPVEDELYDRLIQEGFHEKTIQRYNAEVKKDRELHSKPPWKRFWIFAAGSLMNLMAAFPLCIMMYWIGVDVPVNQIGQVRPGSPEWQAGIEPGETLVGLHVEKTDSTSGRDSGWGPRIEISSLGDYREQLISLAEHQKLKLLIRSGSDSSPSREVIIDPEDPLASGENGEGGQNLVPPSNAVRKVIDRSPAEYAGIHKGDQLISINGYPIHSIRDIREAINYVVDPELTYLIEDEEGTRVIRTLSVPQGTPYLIRSKQGTVLLEELGDELSLEEDLPLASSERVLRVNGHKVDRPSSPVAPSDLSDARIVRAPAPPLRVRIRRTMNQDGTDEQTVTKTLSVYPTVKNEPDYGVNYLLKPVVKSVQKGSPAARAGLEPGDRIVAVDGEPMDHYAEFLKWVDANPGRELTVSVRKGNTSKPGSAGAGEDTDDGRSSSLSAPDSSDGSPSGSAPTRSIKLTPRKNALGQGEIGIVVQQDQTSTPLADLPDRSGFARSGFKSGDRIVTFQRGDGKMVSFSNKTFRNYVYRQRPETIKMEVERSQGDDTRTLTRTYRPVKHRSGQIGIMTAPATFKKQYDFTSGITNGIQRAAGMYALTVIGIKKMFSSTENARRNLAGPVRIFSISHRAAERDLGQFLLILAMITISLGLLNLLPLPPLDGGHILFLFIEKLKGEPLGEDTLYLIQMLGFLFLLLFIILVTYNDIMHLITG